MLTLEDLPKLKIFDDNSNIKVNFSKIAKELGKDRRTIYYISNLWNYLNKKASILSYTCQFFTLNFLDLLQFHLYMYVLPLLGLRHPFLLFLFLIT